MWIEGRQGTGYLKKSIFQGSFYDCWLIKYPPNTNIPPHKDPVKNKKHYRLNVILKGKGDFKCEKCILNLGKIVLFRPDKYTHSVSNGNNERLVLSYGLAL